MSDMDTNLISKTPQVTLLFWIMKIAATTLGETGGDAVSMSLGLGYLFGTIIFSIIFLISIFFQIKAKKFHPICYWVTIIATTTLGTTLADFADRSLHIGYTGGVLLLSCLLMISLITWHKALGSISVTITSSKQEFFYWITIMMSQTLGTALGDWTADMAGLGYMRSSILFGILLALLAALYYWSKLSRTFLFWSAFILTRPLGAALGDFLDKPSDSGGLALNRYYASLLLISFIALCIKFSPGLPSKK